LHEHLDKRAEELLSPPQIPHSRSGIEVMHPPWETGV